MRVHFDLLCIFLVINNLETSFHILFGYVEFIPKYLMGLERVIFTHCFKGLSQWAFVHMCFNRMSFCRNVGSRDCLAHGGPEGGREMCVCGFKRLGMIFKAMPN